MHSKIRNPHSSMKWVKAMKGVSDNCCCNILLFTLQCSAFLSAIIMLQFCHHNSDCIKYLAEFTQYCIMHAKRVCHLNAIVLQFRYNKYSVDNSLIVDGCNCVQHFSLVSK